MGEKTPHFSNCLPLSPSKSSPGEQAVNKKRELLPEHTPPSPTSLVSPLGICLLMADLNLGAAAGPTPFYTDSRIVLDGLACDKLVKSSRWLAARYAMLRYGAENHLIAPHFVGAEDNVADLLTKPLTGETFIRLRRIALGTA